MNGLQLGAYAIQRKLIQDKRDGIDSFIAIPRSAYCIELTTRGPEPSTELMTLCLLYGLSAAPSSATANTWILKHPHYGSVTSIGMLTVMTTVIDRVIEWKRSNSHL